MIIENIDLGTLNIDTEMSGLEKITLLHVKITNVRERAENMIEIISDTSWINSLDVVARITFESRVRRTIEKLVTGIFQNIEDEVTSDFGEYLVSMTSQQALEGECLHSLIPLAELIKEKVSGNPGFDFHTESDNLFIVFGEAKYCSTSNPYTDALTQIARFITEEKDRGEILELSSFLSEQSIQNFDDGKKAFTAAFSLNAKDINTVFRNVINSEDLLPLLNYEEMYLIGVEVVA